MVESHPCGYALSNIQTFQYYSSIYGIHFTTKKIEQYDYSFIAKRIQKLQAFLYNQGLFFKIINMKFTRK